MVDDDDDSSETYNPREIDYYIGEYSDHKGAWGDTEVLQVVQTFIERAESDKRSVDWSSLEILYEDEEDYWYARVMLWPDGI